MSIFPQFPETFFDGPGFPNLKVHIFEGLEFRAMLIRQVFGAEQPEIFRPFESVVSCGGELPMFLFSHRIHGLNHMAHDMKTIKDDFLIGTGHTLHCRPNVGRPHIHGHGFHTI